MKKAGVSESRRIGSCEAREGEGGEDGLEESMSEVIYVVGRESKR
jgi:hypothetical protein